MPVSKTIYTFMMLFWATVQTLMIDIRVQTDRERQWKYAANSVSVQELLGAEAPHRLEVKSVLIWHSQILLLTSQLVLQLNILFMCIWSFHSQVCIAFWNDLKADICNFWHIVALWWGYGRLWKTPCSSERAMIEHVCFIKSDVAAAAAFTPLNHLWLVLWFMQYTVGYNNLNKTI